MTSSLCKPRYFAILPAAGVGTRAQIGFPKQYLSLNGLPILFHTLRVLLTEERITQIFIVLSPNDQQFNVLKNIHAAQLTPSSRLTPLWCGGKTRKESVLNGLHALHSECASHDWIIVHDAARPLLKPTTLTSFINQIENDEKAIGGVLGVPVRDTMKCAFQCDTYSSLVNEYAGLHVKTTIDRSQLWHAQTPQMFRYEVLCNALSQNINFSDESSAIESLGFFPKLILGDHTNIKITYPEDVELACAILKQRENKYNINTLIDH